VAENENKDEINKEIEMVSKDVTKIRNEIKLCNEIKVKVPEIKEQIKAFNKKENDEKQKEIQKKKQRRWER
jgi:hypothetical protein